MKKTALRAMYTLPLLAFALLSQIFWWWDEYTGRWLSLLTSPNEWHFAWLVLFLGTGTWLWIGCKLIRNSRDDLLFRDARCKDVHWFWVMTFGSWKRLFTSFGLLLASLAVLTVGCGILLQELVWQSKGARAFQKDVLDFWKNNLSAIKTWTLYAIGAACLISILSYWPAGDALGVVGSRSDGRRDHAVEQKRNLLRSWVLVLISAFVLTSLGAVVGLLSLSLVHLSSSMGEFLSIMLSPFSNGEEGITIVSVISGIFGLVWKLVAWIPRGAISGLAVFNILWNPTQWSLERIGLGAAVLLTGCLAFYFYFYLRGGRYITKLLKIESPTPDLRKRLIEAIRRVGISSHYPDARVICEGVDLSSPTSLSALKSNINIRLGVINSESPNAFTFGRSQKNAHIVVTSGLLNLLDGDELQAVIAHEMGHILNRDTYFVTLAIVTIHLYLWSGLLCVAFLAGSLLIVRLGVAIIAKAFKMAQNSSKKQNTSSNSNNKDDGNFMVFAIMALGASIGILGLSFAVYLSVNLLALALAMIAAKFSSSGISQRREFAADAIAVKLTNRPEALISSLEKMSAPAHTHSSIPRLAFFSPLCIQDVRINAVTDFGSNSGFFKFFGKKTWQEFFNLRVKIFRFLFRSHPSISHRVNRLQQMKSNKDRPNRVKFLDKPDVSESPGETNRLRINVKNRIKLKSSGEGTH